VADVLRKYAALVDEMRVADWQPMDAPRHETPLDEAAVIRDGFGGDARAAVVGQMRAAHAVLVAAVRASDAESFGRRAAVTFSGSSEPYSTSSGDIVGWVNDHYQEHTRQVTDLVSAWAASTR
jgi:hypothetical protein